MTDRTPRRLGARLGPWTLCVGLVLAFVAASVAAEPVARGRVLASEVALDGDVTQAGSISLVTGARGAEGQGVPFLHVEGEAIEWTEGQQKGPVARTPLGDTFPLGGTERTIEKTAGIDEDPEPQREEQATFDATEAQGQFILHIYSGSAPMQASATLASCTVTAVQRPHMSKADGVVDKADPQHAADANGETTPYDFAQFDLASPLVLTSPEGASELVLAGDFTIELWGVSGKIAGASGGVHEVRSGTWWRPLAPGAPSDYAYEEDYIFLRMVVTGGSAKIAFDSDVRTQWAGPGAGLAVKGDAQFESATGSVETQSGETVSVNAAQYTLSGNNALQATPDSAGLNVDMTGLDAQGNPLKQATGNMASLPDGLVVGLGLSLVAVAALGAGVWALQHRLRRQPAMTDVEAALEAGHYRQAARDAGRILRRKPGMETALISRAIALSKVGKNGRVVDEVESHLQERNPSDGVLHYVLGIAYSDLGRVSEAQAAFQEALRRTPDLLPEVQARLPSGSRIPAPSTKSAAEPHGYA